MESHINNKDSFWIFGHTGLGDMICCNALYRYYAKLHEDKIVCLPIWEHNLASIQWMLSDVPNIFFYPIETEQQLLTCRDSLDYQYRLCLGWYSSGETEIHVASGFSYTKNKTFNPVLWDSEFYRQAGLDPELKWKGFRLPEFNKSEDLAPHVLCHQDESRGFVIKDELTPHPIYKILPTTPLEINCQAIYYCHEIHCIDSSMLNLADLMETPYCKRFVFHRYARKGLPPQLRKSWEIID